MDTNLLYAPPIATAPAAPAARAVISGDGGLELEEQDWHALASLSRWMRFVATFYFLGATFMALTTSWFLYMLTTNSHVQDMMSADPWWLVRWLVSPFTAVLLLACGVSLWQSAARFRGAILDADDALPRGFRTLRRYLLIYGAWLVVQLIASLAQLLNL